MLFYDTSTQLGQTYAAMYPNGFDRLTLDGVINAEKYYSITDYGVTSIADTNKAKAAFLDICAASVPCTPISDFGTCCAFWNSSAAAIQVRQSTVM